MDDMGNSQSIRIGSRHIRIDTRALFTLVLITLGFLTLSHLALGRLAHTSSIKVGGSSGSMG